MKKFFLILLMLLIPNFVLAKEPVNIVFAIDNNFVIPTMVAVDSIFENSKPDTKYNFYVLETGLTKRSKGLMTNYIEKKHNHNVSFISIDNGDIAEWEKLHVSVPIIIARIAIPDLLPKEVERVIYMDGDILVTGDLSELYNLDLGSKSTGMVKDYSELALIEDFANFGFKFDHGYYNAGIILMDLNKWRARGHAREIFETMYANPKKYKEVMFADQNVISEVLGPHIKRIDPRWNNQCWNMHCVAEDMKTGGVYHYIVDKPWVRLTNLEKSFSNILYVNHWQTSEFKNYIYYYLLKIVEKTYQTRISYEYNQAKYLRYFQVLKNNKHFPKFLLSEFDYIVKGKQ